MVETEEDMRRVTEIVMEISETDEAVCVIPKENETPLCTFIKDGDPEISISIGEGDDVYSFQHFEGNNADLALRYEDEELLKEVELVNSSSFESGGSCFTEGRRGVTSQISPEECIVRTSGGFSAVSRDMQSISIDKNFKGG